MSHEHHDHHHDHDHDGHGHHDHDHHGHGHHGHHHGPGHSHAPANFGLAFAVGTFLNAGFVVAEVIAGISAHSMALVADAGHNLGDVLGLLMAWIAAILAKRAPSRRYTYGLGRGTILAAFLNAAILLVSIGVIAVEAVRRLFEPSPVGTVTIMIVAAIGIAINGVTAWLFSSGRDSDINIRAAFQHMAYDALISLGVVVAGAVILLTGWERIDPLASLAIAGVILVGTWALLKDSVALALDRVPDGIRIDDIRRYVSELPEVSGVHDVHVWPTSTTENAMTLHVVTPEGHPGDAFTERLARSLRDRFSIQHVTMQVEIDETACSTDCSRDLLHA